MPTTIEVAEPFLDLFQPARYKAFYGGRGSAKSHSFAAALVAKASQAPIRVLCAREVQKSINESVKTLLDDKIAKYDLRTRGGDPFFESIKTTIRGANGSEFIFAGLSQLTESQIKSMEGIDIAWVEEAQTISASSLEVLIPTIRKDGSELWFSWNPRSASDPVDLRFRGESPPENSFIRRVNYDENPWFPTELEEERIYDQRTNPHRYAHIWLGEYEPAAIGAIWDRNTLREGRREAAPPLTRVVVSIDPAVSSEEHSNEHGIVVAGMDEQQHGYVLDDASMSGTPEQWAKAAIAAYDRHEADAIVVEINQGGDMVKHTLKSIRPGLRVIEVRATRGKHVRAEPISALYSLGRVSHVGTYPELENQMCLFTASGYEGEGSPDRVDALVWAFTELFPKMTRKAPPKPGSRPNRSNSRYNVHRRHAGG